MKHSYYFSVAMKELGNPNPSQEFVDFSRQLTTVSLALYCTKEQFSDFQDELWRNGMVVARISGSNHDASSEQEWRDFMIDNSNG